MNLNAKRTGPSDVAASVYSPLAQVRPHETRYSPASYSLMFIIRVCENELLRVVRSAAYAALKLVSSQTVYCQFTIGNLWLPQCLFAADVFGLDAKSSRNGRHGRCLRTLFGADDALNGSRQPDR